MGRIWICAIVVGFLGAPAVADEFDDARMALCEKTKGCALERMEGAENMTDQMKEMMRVSLDNMCAGMEQTFGAALRSHRLYEPAIACMNDMANMECAALMDDGADQSPACQQYRALAEDQ